MQNRSRCGFVEAAARQKEGKDEMIISADVYKRQVQVLHRHRVPGRVPGQSGLYVGHRFNGKPVDGEKVIAVHFLHDGCFAVDLSLIHISAATRANTRQSLSRCAFLFPTG